jgi:RHS repeat-associated protein
MKKRAKLTRSLERILLSESCIDKGLSPYQPKSPDAMIHSDHLATPQKLTDSSGQVVWAADYKPFGEASVTVSTITNNLRLPGQYYDAETGLHQNFRRDYNFSGGRYIEADPIGLWAGINIYAYVRNNPLRFVDPLGLSTLPGDPSGLPPNWTPDPTHLDPNGQKFVDPSGRPLLWHPGQPGEPGWGGKPHWHDPCNFGKKHLPPGSNIPDPAPLPPPPVPWWKMLPALIPDPFPIIINPCVINPFSPWCGDNSA